MHRVPFQDADTSLSHRISAVFYQMNGGTGEENKRFAEVMGVFLKMTVGGG